MEECYQAEEDDSIYVSTTKPPIVSDLDKISVLLNGLPSSYQPVIVNITGTPLASLTFEDVITRLMNEEGRLRNIASPTQVTATPSDSHDQAFAAAPLPVPRWKGKPTKSTTSKDVSKVVRCYKCRGVGHIRPQCPTPDSDAANLAVDDDELEEEQAFTAIVKVDEAW